MNGLVPIGLLLTLSGGLAAQVPVKAPSAVVSNAAEITIDLVVRDDKGKPPPDLKGSDVQITDDGSAVKISSLRLVNGSGDHLVTLVFEKLPLAAARAAREAAYEIVKLAPASGVLFSVLAVDGRLRLLQQFTKDREAIRTAISTATGEAKTDPIEASQASEKALTALAQSGVHPKEGDSPETRLSVQERTMNQSTLGALLESQRIVQDQHAKPTLAALLAIARKQQTLTGRKAVVYFSKGLQIDSTARSMLLSIIAAANRGRVSFYAVDSNTLDSRTGGALMAAAAISTTRIAGINSLQLTSDQSSQAKARAQADAGPLQQLAESTTGEYIAATGDVRRPARRMIEDLSSYYEASYVPPGQQMDGRFHRLAAKSMRRGVKIQVRSGYDALPAVTGSAILPFEAPLLTILNEPQLPADVSYRDAVLRLGNSPDGDVNAVVVEVPLSGVEIAEDPNTKLFAAHLSVLAQIRDKSGTLVRKFSEDISRQGALEAREKAQTEVVTFQRHFAAEPGKYTLETTVFDRNSRKFGAKRTNFEIPDAVAGPALSDLALVRRTDPFHADSDPEEPLHYGNGKVVPNLSGTLNPDDKDVSFFFLLHPDSHRADKPQLEMVVRRDKEQVGSVPLEVHADSAQGPFTYMVAIQTASLEPGSYEVSAVLTQGSNKVESTAAFSIAAPAGGTQTAESGKTARVTYDIASAAPSAASKTAATSDAPSESVPANAAPEPARVRRALVITPAATAVAEPPADKLAAILAGAVERATDYTQWLPNFMCIEMTRRSVDAAGNGRFRHLDTITELLRYHDQAERRTTLQVNGIRSDIIHADIKGTIMDGEFGALLDAVFSPHAKAEFHWKEVDVLGNGTVEVFSYIVPKGRSQFGISGSNNLQIKVGFHGLVYIDAATYGVRRLVLEADDIPKDFPTRAAQISLDYDYVAIGEHDYLMPSTGTMQVTRGKRVELNEMEFRDYKKYGAESTIRFDTGK